MKRSYLIIAVIMLLFSSCDFVMVGSAADGEVHAILPNGMFWDDVKEGITRAAQEYSVSVIIKEPDQERDFESLLSRSISQNPDCIVMPDDMADDYSEYLVKAEKRDVRVVL